VKVLLTGSAGFIGSAIAIQLRASGAEVVGVDLMLPQAHGTSTAPPGTEVLDVRDARAWSQVFRGVDLVCHQAAMVGAGVRVADLPDYAAHNDLGTAALLAAMDAHGIDRLVLASSMVVYGEGRYRCPEHGDRKPGPRPISALEAGVFDHRCQLCDRELDWAEVTEDARVDPRSGYAASKVAQEHYAASWARQTGGAAVAMRYHNVYGPGMPRDTPYAGVAAMFRSSLERGEAPQVYEDGQQVRDFVHVEDVARANLAAIERLAGVAPDGTLAAFNVCSGTPISIGDVAALVSRGTGSVVAPAVTGQFRAGDVRHVVASGDRAAEELDFVARIPPQQGLPEFATAPLRA
jgi:dTDP-L-rhamnose 4-epimerase